jgi:choline dehydrogenase-like flavoprotein
MFIDARTLPNRTNLDADLAIIGGGPAGITLARRFARGRVNVVIAEAGGLEYDADVQALYQGENAGIGYQLNATRLRFFGGSSNHWGGYCRPLDPIDFEKRDWVPHSGWPFGISELLPYYPEASEIVEIAPANYDDINYWRRKTGEQIPDLASGRMRQQYVHFSPPTRFGTRYGDELKQAKNIRVLLNANVVDIQPGENGRQAQRLSIRTLTGLTHTLKAKYFVVATGGLENARMLLLSNSVVSAGLGNQNDLVGRFFMEHPHMQGFAEIVVADLGRVPRIFRERVPAETHTVQVAFNPSDSFLRQRRLLNATLMAGVAGEYRSDAEAPSAESRKADAHMDMLRAARRFLADNKGAVDPADTRLIGRWLGIGCACEQVPDPDSRVSLSSDQRDSLGLPRIRLDWRLTEQDRRSIVEHMHSLALEFGALGMGRMRLNVEDDGIWPAQVTGGSHHMGTTRMSDEPKQGVVDRNCRVHGMENLYVAGSSVFPTCGSANPTLTIVALALRLADHLKAKLQ